MKKIFINVICAFIPFKDKRDKLRRKFIKGIFFGMPYRIQGKNNRVIIIENGIERSLRYGEKIEGLDIKIDGNNNLIKLELPIKAINSRIEILNDNAVIDIGTTNHFSNVYIRIGFGTGQVLKIGRKTTIYQAWIVLDGCNSIYIGEDCMFSNTIRLRSDDGHSILDKDIGEIINEPKKPLVIGNHCWIGENTTFTKNARIGNNSIVATGCVACKDYEEENVIIAGNPGKIVKRNITWDRRNTYSIEKLNKNKENR